MIATLLPVRPRLMLACSLAALTAVAVAGCAAHRETPRHGSIKDETARSPMHRVAAPMPASKAVVRADKPTADHASDKPASPASEAAKPAEKMAAVPVPAPVVVVPPAPAEAPKKAAATEAPVSITSVEPKPNVQTSRPAVVVKPLDAPPAVVAAPQAKPAAPQPPDVRPTTELRRTPQAVPAAPAAPTPVIAPVAPPSVPPAVAPPKPADVVAAPIAPLAQPKAVPLSPDQRVRETIERAAEHMKSGRILNARALLQDAARSNNPDVLMALAETYDPVVLGSHFPRLRGAAEPAQAISLYEKAQGLGASAAAARLDAVRAFQAGKRP